jgi:hypothetical protein
MPLTTVDQGLLSTNAQYTGFKNRIINGDMVIDQRNNGASVTVTGYGYNLDRFVNSASQSSKFTVQRNAGSVTPPAGFINYLGCTSSAATSLGASDYFLIGQPIEGLNVADLAWGTANAQTVTVSFWVRSSLTGTFGGSITNAANNRSYPYSYTISSANTWEQKSVTIAGDTSGTWLTTNGIGLFLWFSLGVGSNFTATAGSWVGAEEYSATGATSVVGTNGATFYITGVQLEKGQTATSFDVLPYTTELALCQRYYQTYVTGGTYKFSARTWVPNLSSVLSSYLLPVQMRTNPTATKVGTWFVSGCSQPNVAESLPYTISVFAERTAGGTGDTFFWSGDGTGVTLSAEL